MGLDQTIDITGEQRATILALLECHLPDTEAWAYGSRVKWTSRPQSDLDLVVFATEEQQMQIDALREAFEESDLPFRVDLFVWDEVPESFKDKIKAQRVVLTSDDVETVPGWRRRDVSDLIRDGLLIVGDGYRAKNSELSGSGLPFARAGNIADGFRFSGADRFPEDGLHKVGDKISRPGDVVFTSKGTVGRFAFVRGDTEHFVYSPQLCYWRPLDRNVIDPYFLYCWMRGPEFFGQFRGVAGQTDMAEYVSLTDQRRMFVTLPTLAEQRAIAHVLGALDDKIELNRRMNATLETMARALFRSWFVDFDPVRAKMKSRDPGLPKEIAGLFPDQLVDSELGAIPDGWAVGTLGEVSDVIDCLHSKKPSRMAEGRSLLQLWNIRDDGLTDMSDAYLINETDYERWTSRIEVREGDCVITNVGRVGAVSQIPPRLTAALGRNMTAVRCVEGFGYPTFMIQALLSDAMRREIDLRTDSGTILNALNVRSIPKLRFVRAPEPVLEVYERIARPTRARMEANLQASRALAVLCDALLPKLVSGGLRIKSFWVDLNPTQPGVPT